MDITERILQKSEIEKTKKLLQEIEMEEEKEMLQNKKNIFENIGKFLGTVGGWFLSALFIWWGWNVLAPHINLFTLGYWEVFAIRMAFSYILHIIGKTFKK